MGKKFLVDWIVCDYGTAETDKTVEIVYDKKEREIFIDENIRDENRGKKKSQKHVV